MSCLGAQGFCGQRGKPCGNLGVHFYAIFTRIWKNLTGGSVASRPRAFPPHPPLDRDHRRACPHPRCGRGARGQARARTDEDDPLREPLPSESRRAGPAHGSRRRADRAAALSADGVVAHPVPQLGHVDEAPNATRFVLGRERRHGAIGLARLQSLGAQLGASRQHAQPSLPPHRDRCRSCTRIPVDHDDLLRLTARSTQRGVGRTVAAG